MSKFRYFSRSEQLKKIFLCCFSFALFILFGSALMQTKMYELRSKHDQQIYGNFDGMVLNSHSRSKQILEENQMVSTIGQIMMYDPYVLNDTNVYTGSFDQPAEELSSFQFVKGRFPKTEEEGLIEISTLDRLGLSYDLNQDIVFRSNGKDRPVKIVGIIQNYTNSWESGRNFPSLILGNGPEEPSEIFLLVRMKDGYSKAIYDINLPSPDILIRNKTAELSFDLFSEDNRIYTVFNALSLLAMAALLIYFFQNWIKKHTSEIISLKAMGASTKRMNHDITHLMIVTAGSNLLLFFLISVLFHIEWYLILIDCFFFLLVCISCWTLLSCTVRKIPCIFSVFESENMNFKTYPSFCGKITPAHMALRYMRFHMKSFLWQAVVLGAVGALLAASTSQYFQNIQYASWTRLDPDFVIRSDLINEDPDLTFSEKDLGKISDLPDVVSVEFLWQTLPEYSMYWSDDGNSVLREMEKDEEGRLPFNFYNMVEEDEKRITIHDVSAYSTDHWNKKEQLYDQIEGDVDWEEYEKGNEIVLYLPEMVEVSDTENNSIQYDAKGIQNEQNGQRVFEEKTLHPGDLIEIKDPAGKIRKVKVGGVIRTYREYASSYNSFLYFPYSIMGSDAFFGQGCHVNEVAVWLDNYQNLNWIESQLNALTISRHMIMENKSHENERQISFFENEVAVYLIVSLFLGFLFVGLCMYFSLKNMEQKRVYKRELNAALIPQNSIQKIFRLQTLFFIMMCILMTLIFSSVLCIALTIFIPNLSELHLIPYNLFDLNTGAPTIVQHLIQKQFFIVLLILLPIEILVIFLAQKMFHS